MARQPIKEVAKQVRKTVNGVINQIIFLRKKGYERGEIIQVGYNKNTVHRQVHEWEKEIDNTSNRKSPSSNKSRSHGQDGPRMQSSSRH